MTLFSLFPFLIFLTTLAGEFGQRRRRGEFVDLALEGLPPTRSARRSGRRSIRWSTIRRTGLMTISILASLWATSSGLEALRDALNKAYGIEESRSIWLLRLQSLAFTIIISIGIILVHDGAGDRRPVIWSYVEPLLERAVRSGAGSTRHCAICSRSRLLYAGGRAALSLAAQPPPAAAARSCPARRSPSCSG